MSQLYARVFTTILDSSIAEDFRVRHVFEDFLKVCTTGDNGGIVDMTREALSRRFNMPLEELNQAIATLEAPDPKSRDQRMDGRRLIRLDDHRDWGWQIVNWVEYEKLKTRADVAARVAKHRAAKQSATESTTESNQWDIEAVYEAYPKKVGKPKALISIQKAVEKHGYSLVLDRTKQYARAVTDKESQYIPHPATWFNQERFNDDPATWNNSARLPLQNQI